MSEAEKYLDFNLILKLGSKDNKVKTMQQSLKLNISIYGEVQVLQRWLGVPDDGIFGQETKNALIKRTGRQEIMLRDISDLWDITLQYGVRGKEVEKLQRWLGGLTPDEIFGSDTEKILLSKMKTKKIKLSELPYYTEKIIHESLSEIKIDDGN